MEAEYVATIAINTYNYATTIKRAVDSALDQEGVLGRIEVLVVDDGSVDGTNDIIKTYGEKVRYVYQRNQGQAAAINRGLSEARGSVICLLDADDVFYPSKVARIIREFESREQIDVILNRFDIVSESKVICSRQPRELDESNIAELARIWRIVGVPTSGISLRKTVADRITIPAAPFKICADSFLLAVLPQIANVGIVREPLHGYVWHTANSFQAMSEQGRRDTLLRNRREIARYGLELTGRTFFDHPRRVAEALRLWHLGEALKSYWAGLKFLTELRLPLSIKLRAAARLHLDAVKEPPPNVTS